MSVLYIIKGPGFAPKTTQQNVIVSVGCEDVYAYCEYAYQSKKLIGRGRSWLVTKMLSVCCNEPSYFVVVIMLSVKCVILQFLEQCSVVCLTDNMVGN